MFFYLYLITVILEFFVISGIIPTAWPGFKVRSRDQLKPHEIEASPKVYKVLCRSTRLYDHNDIMVFAVERLRWFPMG